MSAPAEPEASPTMMSMLALLLPHASVAVTVYVMAPDGVAVGSGLVGSLRPVVGDHWYVSPPCAWSWTDWPTHTVPTGSMLAVSGTITSTVMEAVSFGRQLVLSLSTMYTVYVPGSSHVCSGAKSVLLAPSPKSHTWLVPPMLL